MLDENYTIGYAIPDDIESWIILTEVVKDNFPGLIIDEYRATVIKNIERKSAICVKSDDEIVGVLIYSIKSECLSCMAVHPDHRRKGIASAMIDMMLSHFVKGSRISVTTFREGDSKGVAPRGMYSKFGFIEDELVTEHSYPQQKFILNVR